MKNLKLTALAITLVFTSAFTIIEAISWKVKDNYSVKFISKKINGTFKGLNATLLFDEANPDKSKIHASIDATSFDSGNAMLNDHAKSEEGLNTAKFPAIVFESTSISKDKTNYQATGKLTLKGVTKEIKFPFTFIDETFNGKFTVIPKEYGVTRGGTPEQMEIELIIPVNK